MIIGLSGYARSGKDSVAALMPHHSRRAFADKLREAIWRLDPLIIDGPNHFRVRDIVASVGWENAKVQFPELRRLLQVFGTEIGRHMIDSDLWVKLATEDLEPGDNIVFTDVRFPNEATAIKALGGQVWRITRPGVVAFNDHASETSMESWSFDAVIENDGSLDDLRAKVAALLAA